MHMRQRPWAKPELQACEYFVKDPVSAKGHWADLFTEKQPMHIELGCGKGVSTCVMAHENRNINFVAVDMISTIVAMARRNIEYEYNGEKPDNIVLAAFDVTRIPVFFGPEDKFERIYISFCNPWDMKARHEKRRLTHTRQLELYKTILAGKGEIWFKTDSESLWNASLGYFDESGYEIKFATQDLHASGFEPNYMTEHEIKFTRENIKTKFLIAGLR